MSKLYFICGTMNSGKSTALITKEFNYRENGKKTLIVKPTTDTRNGTWGHGEWGLTYSRPMKQGSKCLFLEPGRWNEIENYVDVRDLDIIFVDEAQFCSATDVDEMARWVDEYGRSVLVYALKTTAEGDLFPGSARLLALADEIEIMISVCSFCGRRASHHVRISGGRKLVGNLGVESEDVKYKACCRRCFKRILSEQESGV